ncbi:MAG: glycosyltransferase [Deltaproteobacteria bacterium]|nr:glycosyltransferase [Deltaproteobacteria bacterium]
MKILFLYSEIGPYNIPIFRSLTQTYGASVHVVHWDHKKLKPFVPPPVDNVFYYKRSQYSAEQIYELAQSIDPVIIYVSGWMDKGYLPTAQHFKARGIPVVAGFDDQWSGNIRQRLGILIFRLYLKRCFSHAWVAGPRQYEFARRLGFDNAHILFDMLTCDYNLFSCAAEAIDSKRLNYPESFLYVGNFSKIKGTDILVRAFQQYRRVFNGTWTLICIGNGPLRHLLENESAIEVMDYMSQPDLVNLCARAGVFVLPSRHEQWGVVVHEFATAGLPLLLSDNVGSKATFFIDGFNGVSFSDNSIDALCEAMLILSGKPSSELCQMGENSRRLASRVTPSISAASLMSILPH